jgi:hypothetical protein
VYQDEEGIQMRCSQGLIKLRHHLTAARTITIVKTPRSSEGEIMDPVETCGLNIHSRIVWVERQEKPA